MIFNLGFRITPCEKSDATKDEGRYIKEVLFHDVGDVGATCEREFPPTGWEFMDLGYCLMIKGCMTRYGHVLFTLSSACSAKDGG